MGKAYYCDRCGQLQDDAEIKAKEAKISGIFNEDLEVTLCENCARDIELYVYGDDLKNKKKRK